MTERIVDDSVAFNEAFAEASSAQILLNVLYARDRLPREYSGFKEIATSQKRSLSANPSIASLPLGNPQNKNDETPIGTAKLWGSGTLSLTGTAEANPSYGLTPLVGDEFRNAIVSATSGEVFESFWETGWPRDVLMAVLVERAVKVVDCKVGEARLDRDECKDNENKDKQFVLSTQKSEIYSNEIECLLYAKQKVTGCREAPKGTKVNSTEWARTNFMDFAISIAGSDETDLAIKPLNKTTPKFQQSIPLNLEMSPDAGISIADWKSLTEGIRASMAAGLEVTLERSERSESEDSSESEERSESNRNRINAVIKKPGTKQKKEVFVTDAHDQQWVLELRSFDKAIAYLGEYVRYEQEAGVYGFPEFVTNADVKKGQVPCLVPLFRVRTERGIGRFTPGLPRSSKEGFRNDDAAWAASISYRGQRYFAGPASAPTLSCEEGKVSKLDRTATVLGMLGLIFEINRSSENLALPARVQ